MHEVRQKSYQMSSQVNGWLTFFWHFLWNLLFQFTFNLTIFRYFFKKYHQLPKLLNFNVIWLHKGTYDKKDNQITVIEVALGTSWKISKFSSSSLLLLNCDAANTYLMGFWAVQKRFLSRCHLIRKGDVLISAMKGNHDCDATRFDRSRWHWL